MTELSYLIVFVTAPSSDTARELSSMALSARLAACASSVPGVVSAYRWNGKIEESTETLILMKTRSDKFQMLKELIVSMHPYEVPEIVASAIVDGDSAYLAWIDESLQEDDVT